MNKKLENIFIDSTYKQMKMVLITQMMFFDRNLIGNAF